MSSESLLLPSGMPAIRRLIDHGSIAQSLQIVESLRQRRFQSADFAGLTQELRRWQAQRFRQTYADVLANPKMAPAAVFFLTELYSDQEFQQRDAQFARIAGTIERLFPQSVVQTATLLAQLHALSETLDACMALAWQHALQRDVQMDGVRVAPHLQFDQPESLSLYQALWKACLMQDGFEQARREQLQATSELGLQLQRHTSVPGLRLMLKMMRAPASAAGLHDLQRFLESGFDTFGQLGRAGKAPEFLRIVNERESAWIAQMARTP
jgi:hypothetical protein